MQGMVCHRRVKAGGAALGGITHPVYPALPFGHIHTACLDFLGMKKDWTTESRSNGRVSKCEDSDMEQG